MTNIIVAITLSSAFLGVGQVIYISFENKKREQNLLSSFNQESVQNAQGENFIDCNGGGISKQVASKSML